jgi:primase-polymerase (primpol)-like protein
VEVVVLGEKVVGKDETEMRVEKNTEEENLLVKLSMQERKRKKKGAKLRRK